MIRSLWLELHQRSVMRGASEATLAHFLQRATGVEALQWLSTRQTSDVIEQLKQWRRRVSRTSNESSAIP